MICFKSFKNVLFLEQLLFTLDGSVNRFFEIFLQRFYFIQFFKRDLWNDRRFWPRLKWLKRWFTLLFGLFTKGTGSLNNFFRIVNNFYSLIFHNSNSSTYNVTNWTCTIFSCFCFFNWIFLGFRTSEALECYWFLKSGTDFTNCNAVFEKQICFLIGSSVILIVDKVLNEMYLFNNICPTSYCFFTFR